MQFLGAAGQAHRLDQHILAAQIGELLAEPTHMLRIFPSWSFTSPVFGNGLKAW